jgi:superfamily I DNA/RNA helicase
MKFEDLNDEQKVAVAFPHNLLLTACPGSGKTRVTTHKVAWEIENATSPRQKVVALTYTIRAAEEIERRLEQDNIDPSRFWAGNIHSFCLNWILRPYASFYEKTKRGFSIIDGVRSGDICKEICDTLGIDPKVLWDLKTRINPDGTWMSTAPDMIRILDEYEKHLTDNRLVDFDRILSYAFDLLQRFPKIGKNLSSVFSVILVDEYQDTQELQYQIIFQISRNGEGKTRVCFLGDPDQAIYGSLGGVAKSKEEIEAGLGYKIHHRTLPGNYRSSQRIVNFYRNFQEQNLAIEARGKYAADEGSITFNETVHHKEIVSRLAGLIQTYQDRGISENEICVLVPQWYLVMSVASQLRQALPGISIDATGVGPMSGNRDNFFYKLTRLLLTEPSPKIYSRRVKWAVELIEELVHYYSDPTIEDSVTPKKFLKTCNGTSSTETDVIDYLQDRFTQLLDQLGLPKNQALTECRDSYIKGVQKKVDDDRYALPKDIDTFRNFFKEAKGIVISSCHGVKGEEFEVVIAFGLVFGHLPHWSDYYSKETDHHDTAKKLLYVTCSRARRYLHLISEKGRGKRPEGLEPTKQLIDLEYDYDDLLVF